MNEFDQFVKHGLKVKSYVRYTDDFILVAQSQKYLQELLPEIQRFLKEALCLELHPSKISIRTVGQGVDFLGYVLFPHHRIVRTETKRRMFRKLQERMDLRHKDKIDDFSLEQSLQSYLGVMSHADTYKLREKLKNEFWFN